MVNKNIQMKARNGSEWDNLFPLTLNENVYNNEGIGLSQQLNEMESTLQNEVLNVRNDLTDLVNKSKELSSEPLEIIAHRGYRDLYPENTMIAFTNALIIGADSLELDLQMTSDGVPVVIHDDTVNRTTTGTGNVSSFTLINLQQLDAGSKFGGSLFSEVYIPTFEEVLKLAKGKVKRIYPELKGIRSLSDIEIIVDLIKQYNMEEITCLQSFDFSYLDEVRKYSDKINFGYLKSSPLSTTEKNKMKNDGNCSYLGTKSVYLNNQQLPMEYKKNYNIDLGAWTVNDKEELTQLLNLGVSKIMTDRLLGEV